MSVLGAVLVALAWCFGGCTVEDVIASHSQGAGGAAGTGGTEEGGGGAEPAAEPSGWCASRADAYDLCEDFDDPATAELHLLAEDGTAQILAEDPSSSPSVMRGTVTSSAQGGLGIYAIRPGTATKSLVLAYDLRLVSRSASALILVHQLRFGSPEYHVELFAGQTESFVGEIVPGLATNPKTSFGWVPNLGVWYRIEHRIDLLARTQQLSVAGTPWLTDAPLGDPTTTGEIVLQVGMNWVTAGEGATVDVDSLTLQFE